MKKLIIGIIVGLTLGIAGNLIASCFRCGTCGGTGQTWETCFSCNGRGGTARVCNQCGGQGEKCY